MTSACARSTVAFSSFEYANVVIWQIVVVVNALLLLLFGQASDKVLPID